MHVSKVNISFPVSFDLPALIVEPESQEAVPVLLFLHGKGEAGSSASELPKVCIHQTPPFQALVGRLPGVVVVAPQAPPVPTIDDWNWRGYVDGLRGYLLEHFGGRMILATGFSRGGLGVLQLASDYPDFLAKWAIIDPQPAQDKGEEDRIVHQAGLGDKGWIRYGTFRNRNRSWELFSRRLLANTDSANQDIAELAHDVMALRAYNGDRLSADPAKNDLYTFLGVRLLPK